MAESRESGKSRQYGTVRAFEDQTTREDAGAGADCRGCEALLADAVDGTLSEAEQELFDLHAEDCEACGHVIADARRGAAWLEMLRDPAPEPPAGLLARILAQTSSAAVVPAHRLGIAALGQDHAGAAAMAQGYAIAQAPGAATLIAFPRRAVSVVRRTAFGQVMLQPRLAMTAAMAFLSVALTFNITGIHPLSLRASDLKPSSLRRDVISANTHVVRYYESLRVVYELESRLHDLQTSQDMDLPAGSQTGPTGDLSQPANQTPSSRPQQHKSAPLPSGRRPAPDSGTSRRDDQDQPRRLLVSKSMGAAAVDLSRHARAERKLA